MQFDREQQCGNHGRKCWNQETESEDALNDCPDLALAAGNSVSRRKGKSKGDNLRHRGDYQRVDQTMTKFDGIPCLNEVMGGKRGR